MTDALFRDDADLRECTAQVTAVRDDGGIVLDRTVFYYTAGGQPGDSGTFRFGAHASRIEDTRLVEGEIRHYTAEEEPAPTVGTDVTATIDWARRYGLMKMHTSLHLTMAVVPYQINGCQIGEQRSRIDFDPQGEKLDKTAIEDALNHLISKDLAITAEWVPAARLDDDPALIRTMATEPPRGDGMVRLVRIGDQEDLQPCGGTHVASTGKIGALSVVKIDNKGARNKRITVTLA